MNRNNLTVYFLVLMSIALIFWHAYKDLQIARLRDEVRQAENDRNSYRSLWQQDELVVDTLQDFAKACQTPGLTVGAIVVDNQSIALVCVQDPTKH